MVPAIVFVHIGDRLPPWLATAVGQARLFNEGPIYLVAAARALEADPLEPRLGVTAV